MVGKDCVANITSNLRLGNQALGISSNFQKVRVMFDLVGPTANPMANGYVLKIFYMTDRIFLGLPDGVQRGVLPL